MKRFALLLLPLLGLAATPVLAQRTDAMLRAELLYADVVESPDGSPYSLQEQDSPPPDRWLALDKAKHFAVSFLWTVSTQYTLEDKFTLSERQALPFSVASAAAVGVSKEFYDWNFTTGLFSRRDLVADALGIGAAAVFIWL